jgi:hypothetical protein
VRSTAASAPPPVEGEDEALNFIRALHRAPHASFASAGDLDWSRAPSFLPASLGAGLVALPAAEPPWQSGAARDDALGALGRWLAVSLSCHRTRLAVGRGHGEAAVPGARRAIASGGAAYPTDLYLRFGAEWAAVSPVLPNHWWLYLPHRHSLAAHCAAEPAGADDRVEATLVTVLSRTAFKYREFAYRLSAVDTGVAIGRLAAGLAAGGAAFEAIGPEDERGPPLIEPEEQVAGRLICRFPGALNLWSEAPVEAVPLRVDAGHEARRAAISAGQPAMFAALAKAPRRFGAAPEPSIPIPASGERIALPDPPVGRRRCFAAIVHARRSEASAFTGVPVPLAALAGCLRAASRALVPLRGFTGDPGIALGCALIGVQGAAPVAGLLDPQAGAIQVSRTGSAADLLNRAMLLHAFDMRQCGFVIHMIADVDGSFLRGGPGGYRRTQIGVGAMLDAATLAAVEAGLSAHAFLGFSAPELALLYDLDPQGSVLPVAQLCVGTAGHSNQWETAIVG